jgi:excisionase family DNA binding protein
MNKNGPTKKLLHDLGPGLQFFSIAEVSIILGVSTKTTNNWINDGLLPAFRLGPKNRLIRIRRQDLEKFVDTHIRSGEIHIPINQG